MSSKSSPMLVVVQSADLDEHVASEQTEGAADQDQSAEPRPPRAPEQERPEVLDDLDPRQPAAGQLDPHDATRDHAAAVRGANRSAGGDHAGGVVGERLGDPQESVGLEDGVRIDHGHEGFGGGVDAQVDRFRATRVLLAHDDEAGAPVTRDVDNAANRCLDGDVPRDVPGDLDEVERLHQAAQRGVAAAVVDDHDLVVGVAQGQQRLHRGDDAGFLVVCRHDQGDPGLSGPPRAATAASRRRRCDRNSRAANVITTR